MNKIQLTIDDHPRDGYFYASPFNKDGFNGDYKNFGNIFEAGQVTEIYGPNFLDYMPHSGIVDIINHWHSLLRLNGKIILGGKDPYILAKRLIARNITIDEYNHQMFGKVMHKSMIGCITLRKILESCGFVIENVYFDENKVNYTIMARKV